jgi:geranylgeranyl diphosphate synthase type II
MRYGVLNGGKRVRPTLVLAAVEACSGSVQQAVLPACAIELFHSYSLIHDDLPCLDNDEYRRGLLTCHKKFGEPYALLAGDALLTLGFQVLAKIRDTRLSLRLIREISEAIGTSGMIGGQVVDKMSETREINLPVLDYINVNKTGKLIRVSCLAGAIAARATKAQERALKRFGEYLGLAFQVVDDIMDRNGYLKFMTETQAREKAAELTTRAVNSLQLFGRKADTLKHLANFILNRKT